MVFHSPLLTFLDSKTKQKIIGFLLKHEALMSEREIAAVSGVSHMSINRIMRELAKTNFVHFVRAGRTHLWRINRASYAFDFLSGLFTTLSQNTAPLEDLKRTILDKLSLPSVENVILFGSVATGKERFDSDIDLFIQVKDESKKQEIAQAVEGLALLCLEKYGNPLSPYILTEKEWKERGNLKLAEKIEKGISFYAKKSIDEP
jgi:predicted nucleotidyltransferase